ncbi:MAG TPA: sigma factor G inhibitor Gin [Bacillota bacterium]|nr:sigma factor G inhibitor Gin [Bacillota bacterium]
MEENLCLSCGKPNPENLKIFDVYLCADCEAQMMASNAGKGDYQHWINSCRKMWEKITAGLNEEVTGVGD